LTSHDAGYDSDDSLRSLRCFRKEDGTMDINAMHAGELAKYLNHKLQAKLRASGVTTAPASSPSAAHKAQAQAGDVGLDSDGAAHQKSSLSGSHSSSSTQLVAQAAAVAAQEDASRRLASLLSLSPPSGGAPSLNPLSRSLSASFLASLSEVGARSNCARRPPASPASLPAPTLLR
jgi:hypothetical protein